MKKLLSLFLCVAQIGIAEASLLLTVLILWENSTNTVAYNTPLIDKALIFSLMIGLLFALSSTHTFCNFVNGMETVGTSINEKQKKVIIASSLAVPVFAFIFLLVLNLKFVWFRYELPLWLGIIRAAGYFLATCFIVSVCLYKMLLDHGPD